MRRTPQARMISLFAIVFGVTINKKPLLDQTGWCDDDV
jgi:hypothetical protein